MFYNAKDYVQCRLLTDKLNRMNKAKEQLYYLKTKILKLQEVPDNIRLELTNDIYKIEQELNIDDVSKSVAIDYAGFCVICDRAKLPIIKIEDYIEQYVC